MLRRFVATSLLFLGAFNGTLAHGNDAPATRVLQKFDFEEREHGNLEDVPLDWVKVEGPGLPHYVEGKLSSDDAHSGRYSFKIDLNGGSVIYRYPAGLIRIQSGAHYRIESMVKTTALPAARARLTAYFADVDKHPLKNTVVYSEPFASAAGDKDWQKISLDISDNDQKGAYLVVEMGLVQPELYRTSTLGAKALFEQDITGSAWFDDVSISQVPILRLTTDQPGNVFKRSDPLRMKVDVNDCITKDLIGQLILRDGAGRKVYQHTGEMNLTGDANRPNQQSLWQELPDVAPGWYSATLTLYTREQEISQGRINFIRLADDDAPGELDRRFGVIATSLPPEGWNDLPKLLPQIGASRVKLAVWSKTYDVTDNTLLKFDDLLDRLHRVDVHPTGCLIAPPPKIQAKIGGDSWMNVLRSPAVNWQPSLAMLVSRHAGYLDRWQFGLDEQSTDFASHPEIRSAYNAVRDEFAKLVDNPDLAMPWPAWNELPGDLPNTIALTLPTEVLPEQINLYLADVRRREGQRVSLSLQLASAEKYGRDGQITDLVKRVTYAISAGADRIDLPLPFSITINNAGITKQPDELMLVERTLIRVLKDATFRGRMPVHEDIEAFLFDRRGEGVLVMWNRNSQNARKVEIALGEHPTRVDVFGNSTNLLQPPGPDGTVSLEVGPVPIFILGIDPNLAMLRTSIAIDQPVIESSFKPQYRKLKFTNPYSRQITGDLRVTGPKGWTITPLKPNFTLNPGETYEGPMTLEFPYNSAAGNKQLTAEIEVQVDRIHRFKVPVNMRLGLGDIGLETISLRDGNDVIVQQMITNYSGHPLNYTAFTVYPDRPRVERPVTDLAPGATVIKKYRYLNVPHTTAKVRSGLQETEGTRVLNDEIIVE